MTKATNHHTTKSTASPNNGTAKFDPTKMEVPAAFRELADKGVAHAKDTCEKIQAAGEEMTDILAANYSTVAKGLNDYNLKVIEIARTNTSTAFEFANELMGVKSLSKFFELSSAHARKQFEAMTAQTKELTELTQQVTTAIAVQDRRRGDTRKPGKAV
jgi:phasin